METPLKQCSVDSDMGRPRTKLEQFVDSKIQICFRKTTEHGGRMFLSNAVLTWVHSKQTSDIPVFIPEILQLLKEIID